MTLGARSKKWKYAVGALLATAIVIAIAANLRTGEKKIEQQVDRHYAVRDPQFRRSMGVLLGAPILEGNRVADMQNGDEIFPVMLEAIRGAKTSISFETYIYWSGRTGEEFATALAERARAGVKVHVLLDWLGSVKMEDRFMRQLVDAGVEVERYHEPHWYNIGRLNNRTHRKLLVVDGRIGFTGGVGIADQWLGHGQDPDHWRDSHYRLEGPVAAHFQAVFMDNWIKATGRVLHDEPYFPKVEDAGRSAAQMFASSSTGGSESMHLMYLMAIAAASESILLSSAYFVPDDLAIDALRKAMARGVKVRVIVPGPYIDTETVQGASRSRWGPLLEAGVEIMEYQPTMYHLKVLIVDHHMVSVGSTNFDNRSFRLNDEANLNVYDDDFARKAAAVFEDDAAHAHRYTLAEWQARPWWQKAREQMASWIGAQL